MSGDPAVEAAQRACEAQPDGDLIDNDVACDVAIAAAREALAPIRELHKRAYLNDNPYEPAKWDCGECETPWPCDTARLCCTTDELKPKGIQ